MDLRRGFQSKPRLAMLVLLLFSIVDFAISNTIIASSNDADEAYNYLRGGGQSEKDEQWSRYMVNLAEQLFQRVEYDRNRRFLSNSTDDEKSMENNLFNNAKTFYSNTVQSGQNIVGTNPKEWTANQMIIVGIVFAFFWTVVLIAVLCCRSSKSNDSSFFTTLNIMKKKKGIDYDDALINRRSYVMHRPHVTRTSGTGSSDLPAQPYSQNMDASDINMLPLGARLHGAVALRKNNMKGQNVRIAVLDSGIDATHSGFHGVVNTEKYWFRHGTPLEQDDHGTHVAGTIHFMAPDAELFDYRIFGEEGDFDSDTAVAKSIRHAVDKNKCDIINLSSSVSYPMRADVKKALLHAYKKGVHVVCSTGIDQSGNATNEECYSYPASMKQTIAVAAVSKDDGFLPPVSHSENNASAAYSPNYSAMGRNVVSLKPGGGVQTMSGISLAAPHVTGLIACLLSEGGSSTSSKSLSNTSNGKLRKLLDSSYVIDIGEEGYEKETGKGFVTYLADNEQDEFIDLLSLVAH